MKTLLVTGSRHWTDEPKAEDALVSLLREWHPQRPEPEELPVLRHGGARGLDLMAESFWLNALLPIDRMEAKWRDCGPLCPDDGGAHRRQQVRPFERTYCPNAGPLRNRAMCDKEPRPDLVLAFRVAKLPCHGTRDCAAYAESVGLPVRWVVA